MAFERQRQRGQVDAVARMGRHFDGVQAVSLQRLQHRVKGGAFDNDAVARPRHRLQAQVERFEGAVGDDDLVHFHDRALRRFRKARVEVLVAAAKLDVAQPVRAIAAQERFA